MLFVGPEGLTYSDGERTSSVRFSDCVMMLRGEDGYRELISRNGSTVMFLPSAWERGDEIASRIDSEVPHDNVVLIANGPARGMTERRRWRR